MSVIPDKFAVMAIDPGGTTGVARGFFNVARFAEPSTAVVMRRAARKGTLKINQVPYEEPFDRPPYAHAHVLIAMWNQFKFNANVGLGIALPDVHLVIEDFQLNRATVDLAPVKVTAGLQALLTSRPDNAGVTVEFQMPSMAMTYATNERLRSWGLWQVGAEHGRDAARHLALRVSKILDGKGSE